MKLRRFTFWIGWLLGVGFGYMWPWSKWIPMACVWVATAGVIAMLFEKEG